MPDLGPYAGTVLAAYAVALALLAGLVLLSWRRSVRVKRDLARAEATRVAASRAAPQGVPHVP